MHKKAVRDEDASVVQLAEVSLVAASIRTGGAATHASHL
ncbi:hypothetical protein [Vreelandella nanhaiensis]